MANKFLGLLLLGAVAASSFAQAEYACAHAKAYPSHFISSDSPRKSSGLSKFKYICVHTNGTVLSYVTIQESMIAGAYIVVYPKKISRTVANAQNRIYDYHFDLSNRAENFGQKPVGNTRDFSATDDGEKLLPHNVTLLLTDRSWVITSDGSFALASHQ